MWIECGQIGRPVGLRGENSVTWASGSSPVAADGDVFIRSDGESYKPRRIAAIRKQGRSSIVRFTGVEDRNAAERLRGVKLYIPADSLVKPSGGEHYTYEMIGLDVVTEDGRLLGKIKGIFSNGAHDIYEVNLIDCVKKELLIPAVDNIVLSIDIDAGKMIVRLLDGMME